MRYYFLHPSTLKVCKIVDGRSTWEDHIDKSEFIVVKEIGNASEYANVVDAFKNNYEEIKLKETK